MTYQLSRLRLASVGDRAARFTDLTLDMSSGPDEAGEPVDSILWLRNGGGKSSLLSLFFALLLPLRKDFMGKSVKRYLEDYVSTGDTSHTVAEWVERSDDSLLPPARLVTGAVYEWADRRKPADPDRDRDKLKCWYYTFFVVAGILDLDRLPVHDDTGRLRPLADFVRSLREVAASRPQQFAFAITDQRTQWMQTLTARNLDPALFGYQKQMNHSEGGVADMFNFPSSDKFIDFLIDLTVDTAQPELVASNLHNVIEILGRKPDLLVDRDFCAEMADKLDTLAARHAEAQEEEGKAARARQDAARLAGEFRSAAVAQQTDHDWFVEEADRLRGDAVRLDADRKRVNDIANELFRIAAIRRRATALAAHNEKKLIAENANQEALAWSAVEPLAERMEAEHQAESVRAQIASEDRQTAPLRAARDAAAAALKSRYGSLAAVEQASQERELAVAEQAESSAEIESRCAQDNQKLATEASVHADSLRGQLVDIDSAVGEAVDRGYLPDRETAPRTMLARMWTTRRESARQLEAVRKRRRARPRQRKSLSDRRTRLATEMATKGAERDRLTSEHKTLSERVDDLATHVRLAELVQLEEDGRLDLWAEAAELRAALAHAVSSAESDIVNTRVDAADDDRALAGLRTDSFLPTTRDAQRVIEIITDAGITARPGWELLRDLVAESDRDTMLCNPVVAELAAGVVVADDAFEKAWEAVESDDLCVVAHVTVCTATQLQQALSVARPRWSVIPNDPALFDPVAAEQARTIRELRRHNQDQRIENIHAQVAEDRALQGALNELLRDCPAGHLSALEQTINEYREAIENLESADRQLRGEIENLDEQETVDAETEESLSEELTKLAEWIERLKTLADRVGEVPEIQGSIEQLDRDVDRYTALAKEAVDRAAEYKKAERTARERAVKHGYNQERYLDAERKISLLDSGQEVEDIATDSSPLSVLQARFTGLDAQWQTIAAESVLAERLNGLVEWSKRADRILAGFAEDIRARADILLATADGQDDQRRATAHENARIAAEAAQRELGEAFAELKQAEQEVQSRTPRDRPRYAQLDTDPATESEARERAEAQAAQATEMSSRVTVLNREAGEADESASEAKTAAQVFAQRANRLTDAAVPNEIPTGVTAYAGTDEQAEADLNSVIGDLTTAAMSATAARGRTDDAIQVVRKLASESRFSRIPDAIRDRFTSDDADVLAERASARAREMQVRRTTLDGQLADIGRDQRLVVVEIAALVHEVLSNLESAHRHSKLPGTLGGWADQHFLRIRFARPSGEEDLLARIDAVVDRVVAERSKPEGLALLKRCVHEAVAPRGFSVKVLKPNSDLAVEPVDVTHLGKFSGGEKLTVCVALYCTLARLRAINRGRGQAALGGTLVLDNPLGTASHVALLRLQRDVAEAHGVQLVYTTGVEDLGAVGQFPNVLRLRNAPGALRTRRYVVLEERSATAVEGITGVGVTRDEPARGAVQ
ncbi:hypothetical protein [Nocardia sp. CC201C]|uniref:hypothetical protein n=1 Tax=Nocardia sp. CC201C TaxID=3044575 RepID=UPI0024A83D7C|nr:hypothetical protein [Nocardia sp. CC201C]